MREVELKLIDAIEENYKYSGGNTVYQPIPRREASKAPYGTVTLHGILICKIELDLRETTFSWAGNVGPMTQSRLNGCAEALKLGRPFGCKGGIPTCNGKQMESTDRYTAAELGLA